jgi:hypothetical protein
VRGVSRACLPAPPTRARAACSASCPWPIAPSARTKDPPDREGAPQKMGGHGDRPPGGRTGTDSAPEPGGRKDAAAQRAAGGRGLEDALHGAPDLLPAVVAGGGPGDLPSHTLRLVSKACREAVDGTATRCRLDFPCARSRGAGPGGGAWLEPMVRRLGKLPRLAQMEWVTCCDPSGAELEQLLSGAVAREPSPVAGVQRLEVCTTSAEADVLGPGLPTLLRSLAHLPGLQVCARPEAVRALIAPVPSLRGQGQGTSLCAAERDSGACVHVCVRG